MKAGKIQQATKHHQDPSLDFASLLLLDGSVTPLDKVRRGKDSPQPTHAIGMGYG